MSRDRATGFVLKNGYYIYKCNGIIDRCVSCDKPIEHDLISKRKNHHCSEKHIRCVEAASTRFYEPLERNIPYYKRLKDGFRLLSMCGDL